MNMMSPKGKISNGHLLLFGGSLLCGGLLGGGLLGLGGLLGSRLLSGLLCLGLFGSLWLLLGLGSSRQLEASSSLLSCSTSSDDLLGSNHLLEGEPHSDLGLGSISDLVVGDDVLEDSLTAGAVPLLKGLDGSSDHVGIGRMGSRGL